MTEHFSYVSPCVFYQPLSKKTQLVKEWGGGPGSFVCVSFSPAIKPPHFSQKSHHTQEWRWTGRHVFIATLRGGSVSSPSECVSNIHPTPLTRGKKAKIPEGFPFFNNKPSLQTNTSSVLALAVVGKQLQRRSRRTKITSDKERQQRADEDHLRKTHNKSWGGSLNASDTQMEAFLTM